MTSTAPQLLLKICLLAGACLLAAVLLNMRARRFEGEDVSYYRRQYADMFGPSPVHPDALILGSSQASHGMDPRYLAPVNAYTFAYNGAAPTFYTKWYEDWLTTTDKRPDIIVYSVSWFMWNDELLSRRPYHDSRYLPARLFWREIVFSANRGRYLRNRYPLFVYNDQLQDSFLQVIPRLFGRAPDDRDDTPPVLDGERYFQGFIPFNKPYEGKHRERLAERNSAAEMSAFRQLIARWQAEGILVVFVQPPEFLDGREAPFSERNQERLNQLAHEFNIPYLNYNVERVSEINGDVSLFSDWIHLNGKGAERFGHILGPDLRDVISASRPF